MLPAPTAAVTEAAASPAKAPASGPQPGGVDKTLQEKKKKADAAEAAKRQAEEDRIAAAKADNCQRARSAKAGLDSGLRLARVNAKGEREFIDDTERKVEAKRIQAIIDADCK